MRSQLYRLAEVAEHPKATIQIIRSGGAHASLLAHFVIADLDSKPPVTPTPSHTARARVSGSLTAHLGISSPIR
jgi:hypothetical protein